MKLDLDVFAKEMRRARGSNGDRLFAATEFLSAQQISSFFFRLAAKARQKEVQVKEQDALAVEEKVNFSTDRDRVLCESLDLEASIPPVRKKARYVSFLQGLVESCNRSTM